MAKHYLLDIVQFYHLVGKYKINHLDIVTNTSKICFQPETNNIFFDYDTRYLWDKLIRRKIFVKSIYYMKEKFRKERFSIHNDETACFGIFKSAYSYGLLEEVGYFYNRENYNSTTRKNFYRNNINSRFHSLFSTMDYYYEQSDDNIYEKNKGGYHFFEYRIIRKYLNKTHLLTKGFKYINVVINKYLESQFFNSTQKIKLREFKDIINAQRKKRKINSRKKSLKMKL